MRWLVLFILLNIRLWLEFGMRFICVVFVFGFGNLWKYLLIWELRFLRWCLGLVIFVLLGMFEIGMLLIGWLILWCWFCWWWVVLMNVCLSICEKCRVGLWVCDWNFLSLVFICCLLKSWCDLIGWCVNFFGCMIFDFVGLCFVCCW